MSTRKKQTKKEVGKKKEKSETKKKSSFSLFAFLKDERVMVSAGIMLISFSILLTLSFTSYFFTWKPDQSKLEMNSFELFKDASIQVENWIGKLGAALSNEFIHNGFGVASV
ncbi:MAG: DNA translocase FtsK 4TM domain-containing protein, partial [Bacteroidota bacterium]|nr:DNA translocase FtsK 4TM domain-containing protein [Bacteroidota bacterium]